MLYQLYLSKKKAMQTETLYLFIFMYNMFENEYSQLEQQRTE